MADIKVDLRALRDKVDDVGTQLTAKIENVKDLLASAKIRALTLYIAVNWGTLARGFGWIEPPFRVVLPYGIRHS